MKARININVAKKARVAKTSIAKKAGLLVLGGTLAFSGLQAKAERKVNARITKTKPKIERVQLVDKKYNKKNIKKLKINKLLLSDHINQFLTDYPNSIIVVGSEVCAPCLQSKKTINNWLDLIKNQKIKNTHTYNLYFGEANFNEFIEYNLMKRDLPNSLKGIPAILYYRNGKLVRVNYGYSNGGQFIEQLNKNILDIYFNRQR
ncbi:MAG TPA: hypothetical protein PK655_02445 [archaeon]|jgi:hypothetical protein|nr:hypothetical protein [archaeon]